MVSAIGPALSGLAAAGKRFEVSANNVANQQSTRQLKDGVEVDEPYTPKRVEQQSQQNGGVTTKVVDKEPATFKVFSPDNPESDEYGFLELPNVSLEEEVVQQKIASYDYKANLRTLKVQDDMTKGLLDILT